MIRKLNCKDKADFIYFCHSNNIEDAELLFKCSLKWGTKCLVSDNGNIDGILIVKKIKDKHFISIYCKKLRTVSNLIKIFIWNNKLKLYASLKSGSPLIKVFLRFGFRIYSVRNNPTVELIREFDKKFYFKKR